MYDNISRIIKRVVFMKINNINSIYRNNMVSQENLNKKANKEINNKDSIEISSMAKKIHEISCEEDVLGNKKIDEIRNKIKNNTYKVDTKVLADKIFEAIKEGKNE